MNFDALTRFLDSVRGRYGIPALDCIVNHGYRTVYRHAAGFSDAAGMRPVGPHDLYWVYSATKVMTVTAVMQLIEHGRLRLEDELARYLPAFGDMYVAQGFTVEKSPARWPTRRDALRRASTPIRVADLMSMTAGFSYDVDSEEIQAANAAAGGRATTRQMMDALARMPLICEPGTRWAYSLSHDVLAGLVEVVSGLTFGEYLRRYLFSPLGISEAYFDLNEERLARLSAQYRADDATGAIRPVPPVNRYRLSERYESGGAGLICTAEAYAAFVRAMSNGGVNEEGHRILTMASIDALRKNRLDARLLPDFAEMNKRGYGYGLGVRTLMDANASRSPVGEFGWDGAAGAYALMDPENRIGIFFAEHVLSFPQNYREIHPRLRDLVYEALLG